MPSQAPGLAGRASAGQLLAGTPPLAARASAAAEAAILTAMGMDDLVKPGPS